MKFKDLSEQRFGKLTAKKYIGFSKWECCCDCGNISIVNSYKLCSNHTKSCGCLRKESKNIKHGHSKNGKRTSEMNSWRAMIQRCTNEDNEDYYNYGGRGIKVCDRWLNSFENFISDMGLKPNNTYSIDRIDVNDDYKPTNCKWSSCKEQSFSRRNTIKLTYNNMTLNLLEWSNITGISCSVLRQRIYNGWDVERIVTEPVRKKNEN